MRSTLVSLTLWLWIMTLPAIAGEVEFSPTPNPRSPEGTAAIVDIPADQHIKNIGGSDGLGLCVFTSLEVASRWQNELTLTGLQAYMHRQPGGGWPDKVDQVIAAFCRSKNVSAPMYVQHTGGDEGVLELALKTGRCPCVTYAGRDDFYRGSIAHMVDLAHLDQTSAAIIDNNRPGRWVWMTRAEFLTRWRSNGGGWCVVLLSPPPPPPPAVAYGQCPGGVCPTPARQCPGGVCPTPSFLPSIAPGEQWFEVPGVGMRLIKIMPPEIKVEEKVENFGIDQSRVHQGKRYSINGIDCKRDEMLHAIGDGTFADDSQKYSLSIVADDASRKSILDQVAGMTGHDRVHVQIYNPANWVVSARALQPGITLQQPRILGGKVLYRSNDIKTETLTEALDRARPDWVAPKPMPTPTPVDPKPSPTPVDPKPIQLPLSWVILGGIIVSAFYFGKRFK